MTNLRIDSYYFSPFPAPLLTLLLMGEWSCFDGGRRRVQVFISIVYAELNRTLMVSSVELPVVGKKTQLRSPIQLIFHGRLSDLIFRWQSKKGSTVLPCLS